MLPYKAIEIFTSEEARWQGTSIDQAIVQYVRDLKIAARCQVVRGTDGCYESGEVATQRLEILSYNMPLYISIVAPASVCDRLLPKIEEMVTDGIVSIRSLEVVSHKTKKILIHSHIRVRDVMTPSPERVLRTTPLNDVVQVLLSSIFTGVPVVDADERPVGVITQGDLINKAGMPVRLGLLAASGVNNMGSIMKSLSGKKAEEIMTRPVIFIDADRPATEAVDMMLRKKVKRLPVVDAQGKLVGMLSRLDIFRTIMKNAPDWKTFGDQNIRVDNLRFVSDIMRRDVRTVAPGTSVEDVMQMIDGNDIQRIAVVDQHGRFQGLISDSDILAAFSSDHQDGIWNYFVSKLPFAERGRKYRELRNHLQTRTAADVMNAAIVTIREDALIDNAIQIMTERGFKRLPVLDTNGIFKGMISRDSLLRTGFGQKKFENSL